jgi:hypothetical protein
MMTLLAQPDLAVAISELLNGVRAGSGDTSVIINGTTHEAESIPGLRQNLAGSLYRELHAGIVNAEAAMGSPRRDRQLERRLAAQVPHATSPVAAIIRPDVRGRAGLVTIAEIGRVRVRIPDEMVPDEQPTGDGRVLLALPAVRPSLSPGFLLVSGSAGPPAAEGEVLRIYLHIGDPGAAVQIWSAVLAVLEENAARYRAKVLSRSVSFPRRDALVVYLTQESWGLADEIARTAGRLPGIMPTTSPLTRRVAPGVAIAWDPRDRRPGWERMSFGQHRTSALADGIVRYLSRGVPLRTAVCEAFAEGRIDPSDPARNVDSPAYPAGAAK